MWKFPMPAQELGAEHQLLQTGASFRNRSTWQVVSQSHRICLEQVV